MSSLITLIIFVLIIKNVLKKQMGDNKTNSKKSENVPDYISLFETKLKQQVQKRQENVPDDSSLFGKRQKQQPKKVTKEVPSELKQKYKEIIEYEKCIDIKTISAEVKKPRGKVIDDLIFMKEQGYFQNLIIHKQKGTLEYKKEAPAPQFKKLENVNTEKKNTSVKVKLPKEEQKSLFEEHGDTACEHTMPKKKEVKNSLDYFESMLRLEKEQKKLFSGQITGNSIEDYNFPALADFYPKTKY